MLAGILSFFFVYSVPANMNAWSMDYRPGANLRLTTVEKNSFPVVSSILDGMFFKRIRTYELFRSFVRSMFSISINYG
jgi:hypothetical protein